MEVFIALSLVLIVPGASAFFVGSLARLNRFGTSIAVLAAAAVPAFAIFLMTQQADAITRAASIAILPVLFLVMLLPAGLGMAVAKWRSVKP